MRDGRRRPTRQEFAALWFDTSVTVEEICRRLMISHTTCVRWAKRWAMPHRPPGGYRGPKATAEPLYIKASDDHCDEVDDGPGPHDPTPSEILARAWELREQHYAEKRASQA